MAEAVPFQSDEKQPQVLRLPIAALRVAQNDIQIFGAQDDSLFGNVDWCGDLSAACAAWVDFQKWVDG